MSLSFKLAPGVRIRASKGGLRASVGPRAARVHVGGGYRSGVSTGAGPFTLYRSIGTSRRPTRSSSGARSGPSRAGSRRSAGSRTGTTATARAAKAAQANELLVSFRHLLDLHRGPFPPVEVPTAPPSPPVDAAAIRQRHEKEALAGIGLFQRAKRAQAREAARGAASTEIAAQEAQVERQRREAQRQLDEQWRRLCANDLDVVLATLAEAFDDNEVPSAAVGVEGDQVGILTLVPPVDIVPERMPSSTAAGNLSLKKLTKTELASWYRLVVCGHLLAAVRETLAVAPGINRVSATAARLSPGDAYGARRLEFLLAAQFDRERLQGVRWDRADAWQVVADTSSHQVVNLAGQAHEMRPIDLSEHPELRDVAEAVDFDEPG